MNGKGDRPRPTDLEAYGRNYERIFGHGASKIKGKGKLVAWPGYVCLLKEVS